MEGETQPSLSRKLPQEVSRPDWHTDDGLWDQCQDVRSREPSNVSLSRGRALH